MASPKQFTGAEQCRVSEEYLSGISIRELSKRHGCSGSTILRVLVRTNTPRRPCHPSYTIQFTPEQVATAVTLWHSDTSLKDISNVLGVSHHTVRRVLVENGVDATNRNSKTRIQGRVFANGGYYAVLLPPGHRFTCMARSRNPYVLEHRLVMAEKLGRPLTDNETVHHINGDRLDNRVENLEFRQSKHGSGVKYRCRCCGSENVEMVQLETVGVEA